MKIRLLLSFLTLFVGFLYVSTSLPIEKVLALAVMLFAACLFGFYLLGKFPVSAFWVLSHDKIYKVRSCHIIRTDSVSTPARAYILVSCGGSLRFCYINMYDCGGFADNLREGDDIYWDFVRLNSGTMWEYKQKRMYSVKETENVGDILKFGSNQLISIA